MNKQIVELLKLKISNQNKYYISFLLNSIIVSLGIYFNFKVFEPGLYSQDSLFQLSQALNNSYGDWHPPLMAYFWHLLLTSNFPISSLLFVQISLLWLTLFLYQFLNGFSPFSLIIYVIPFLPWIYNFMGVIWKDVLLAYCLLNLSVCFLLLLKFHKFKFLLISQILIMIFCAFNLRGNAIFALIPFIVFLSYYLIRTNNYKIILSISLIVTFLIGLILVSNIFKYDFLKSTKTFPQSMIYTDDLLYFSLKNKGVLIPSVKEEELKLCSQSRLAEMTYTVKGMCFEIYTDAKIPNNALSEIWLKEVIGNPLSYLNLRLHIFSEIIRNENLPPIYTQQVPEIINNDFNLIFEKNKYYIFLQNLVYYVNDNFSHFYKPYFWLIILAISIIVALDLNRIDKSKMSLFYLTILFSSLGYFVGYFFIGGGPDFRYFYWSILSLMFTMLSIMITNLNYLGNLFSPHKIVIYLLLFLLFNFILNNIGNFYPINGLYS